jgi:hypothetical protein
LIGLSIFGQQRKLDEFVEIFNKIVTDKVELTSQIAEGVAKNLKMFDNEKEKMKRLELTERLQRRVYANKLFLTGPLFDALVFIYTESQQWRLVNDLLQHSNKTNTAPELKTVNYLKKNLLYCFDP